MAGHIIVAIAWLTGIVVECPRQTEKGTGKAGFLLITQLISVAGCAMKSRGYVKSRLSDCLSVYMSACLPVCPTVFDWSLVLSVIFFFFLLKFGSEALQRVEKQKYRNDNRKKIL